jgi:hypothetical protein
METTTSSDDARTTCTHRLVDKGVALLFAEEEEEEEEVEDFTDIKPEERSDREEVIVKLMTLSFACCLYLYRERLKRF